jgi:hypothetical protein
METVNENTGEIKESRQMSAEIKDLAPALAKAQGEMGELKKESKNPFFKSNYADISSCWEACRKPLSSNGLSIVQFPSANGTTVSVTTMLLHTSGQWLRSNLTLNLVGTKTDAQAVGSAITYARRYSLMAMVGLAPEDDDGNQAAKPGSQAVKEFQKTHKRETKTSKTLDERINDCLVKFADDLSIEQGELEEYVEHPVESWNEDDLKKLHKFYMEKKGVKNAATA